jgi:hypothetical protein
MKHAEITVRVDLGRGAAAATVWTCDFSYDYVKINADYRSYARHARRRPVGLARAPGPGWATAWRSLRCSGAMQSSQGLRDERLPRPRGAGGRRRHIERDVFRLSTAHRHVRHPWYSFGLVIVWTRDMNAAMLVSALAITLYFVAGSRLEERKLIETHGDTYRRYRERVPGAAAPAVEADTCDAPRRTTFT